MFHNNCHLLQYLLQYAINLISSFCGSQKQGYSSIRVTIVELFLKIYMSEQAFIHITKTYSMILISTNIVLLKMTKRLLWKLKLKSHFSRFLFLLKTILSKFLSTYLIYYMFFRGLSTVEIKDDTTVAKFIMWRYMKTYGELRSYFDYMSISNVSSQITSQRLFLSTILQKSRKDNQRKPDSIEPKFVKNEFQFIVSGFL